jgi:hypothetical protein
MGGAHTQKYVTLKMDGSDKYDCDCLQHKYSRRPAWMFHGTIVFGGKQTTCIVFSSKLTGFRKRIGYLLGEGMGQDEFI